MSLSENIRKFRTEAGYTQEQLAEMLGVSSQAVSKWERSETYPDGALLVPLANALGASLDELFDNCDTPHRSVMTEILRMVSSCSRDDAFKLGRIICWQIERGMFGGKAGFDPHELEYNRNSSTITGDRGFTWVSNGDAPFFALFEEREGGWSNAIGDGEQIRSAFECLGHADTMKAILYLYKQENNFVFESAFLGKECGFDSEQTECVLGDLKLLGICRDVELDLEGEKRTLWTAWQKQLIIGLMVMAKELFFNGTYSLQAESRERPYLR